MADQTVSILALLKDEISGKLKNISGGFNKLNSSVEVSDRAAVNFTTKLARVTNRLLSLQLALQNINSLGSAGSFGKFKGGIDAVTSGLTTFASIAGLFPNPVGVIAGAVAGLIVSFQSLSQSIRETDQDTENLLKNLEKNFRSIDKLQAERQAGADLLGTPTDRLRSGQQGARAGVVRALSEQARLRRQLQAAETQDERGGDIKQLEADIQRLKAAGQDFDLFGPEKQLKTVSDLTKEMERLKKAELDRQNALKTLPGELQKVNAELANQVKLVQELNQKVSDQEALEAFRDQNKKLTDQAKVSAETAKLGLTSGAPTEAAVTIAREQFELEKARVNLFLQNKDLLARTGETVADPVIAAQRAKKILDDAEAADQALKDAEERAKQAASETEAFYQGIAQGIGQAFAQATSSLIDGLIDGEVNMRQFAGQFLLNIGKMITQALVLRAVMAGLGVIGFPGAALARAAGGPVPGPSVNRDVVPAMLTPGEWVMRKSAADYYGPEVMAALNRMLIPPGFFRGMGVNPGALNMSGRFAEGGEVVPVGPGAAQGPAPAFVVANEQSLDRLLAGGGGALIRFMERHKDTIGGILERRRV